MLKDYFALCLKFIIPEPLKYKLISCFHKVLSHWEEQEMLIGTRVSPVFQTGGSDARLPRISRCWTVLDDAQPSTKGHSSGTFQGICSPKEFQVMALPQTSTGHAHTSFCQGLVEAWRSVSRPGDVILDFPVIRSCLGREKA